MAHQSSPQCDMLASENTSAKIFGVDMRALATLRIGMGLLLLVGLAYRLPDLRTHYTDDGTLPRAARVLLNSSEQFTAPPYWVSVHMLSGSEAFQATLFAVSALFAVGIVVGYRTTWCMFASWYLLISLQSRNPLVLQGGDDLLRVILFWACLTPCGVVWSLDSFRRARPKHLHVVSLATAGLLLQLSAMYIFTALLKTGPAWRSDFHAIYYALSLDHFTTPFGYWLLRFPRVLQVLTASTLLLEFVGPLALFVPWRTKLLRYVIFTSFIGLHIGIALTMQLGMFPLICCICWLIVLPEEVWNWLVARIRYFVGTAPQRSSEDQDKTSTNCQLGFVGNTVCVLLLIFVALVNVQRLEGGIDSRLKPGPIRFVGNAFALDQYWCMFSPGPMQFGGWLRIEGVTVDGSHVNLLHPHKDAFINRPENVAATYPSQRWRKYLMNLIERDCPTHRTAVLRHLQRRWRVMHPDAPELATVQIVCMCEPTLPPREPVPATPPKTEAVLIWRSPAF